MILFPKNTELTYPWIEMLLWGGAIRCPLDSLKELLYHLLRLVDITAIEWPRIFNSCFSRKF